MIKASSTKTGCDACVHRKRCMLNMEGKTCWLRARRQIASWRCTTHHPSYVSLQMFLTSPVSFPSTGFPPYPIPTPGLHQSCRHVVRTWANQSFGAHLHNMTLSNGKLRVPQDGRYYLYSQVINPQSINPHRKCWHFGKNAFKFSINQCFELSSI